MPKLLGKYQNGNYEVSIYDDGTKVRYTPENKFVPEFAENIDIKITNKCTGTNCAYCHEGSGPCGKHGDIMSLEFVNTLKPYQEMAIGGGNVLEHPDLIPFLKKLKNNRVIANITVNQFHFMNNLELLHQMAEENLFKGIGVSLINPDMEFIEEVSKFEHAVIHVINGIVGIDDITAMCDKNLAILILGYKRLRRGRDFQDTHESGILYRQKTLYSILPDLPNRFRVVSFDNLAIEQLDVKRLLTNVEWKEFYMGDDGNFTFYIDAVEEKFAKSSTAAMERRYPLKNDVAEMFNEIKNR